MVKNMSRLILVCLTLTVFRGTLIHSHAAESEECLTSFTEVERMSIHDNPGNKEALTKAFYRTNKPFPLSVRIVYHTNSSNGTDMIISTDPSCPPEKEMWFWIPSPIFTFMDPTKLNLCALYTLNYFSDWDPPHADIYMPNICNISHNRFNFLNDLTMRAQMYASTHISGENGYLGYVLKGCGDKPTKTVLVTTQSDNNQSMSKISQSFVVLYMLGNLFQVVLVLLVSVLFLQRKGHAIASRNSTTPASYDNYGIFWGCVAISLVGNGLLITHTIMIIKLYLTSGVFPLIAIGWVALMLLVIVISTSLMVALYYGRKLDLSIPSVFLLPFTILFCNRAKQFTRIFVQILALWNLLSFLYHVLCRASFVFLALLARPPTVISTSLLYLFAAFCSVHFMAIIFTSTKLKKKEQWKKHKRIPSIVIDVVQTFMFTFIFATALCFGLVIGAAGALANYGTIRNSPYPTLSNLVTPLALAVFGWTLRKVGSQWLSLHTRSPADLEVNEQLPLLQRELEGISV